MSENRPASRGALALAILLPLLILIPCLYALTRPLPVEQSRRAAAMDAALKKSQPEVVVVGNSLVGHGVDAPALAAALGLPRDKVAVLWVPGSPSYTWYLILKNRVYANGYRPRLIIAAGALPMLFRTDQGSALARAGVAEMSGEHEPEIAAKILGESAGSLAYTRFDTRRRKLRDGLADQVRVLPAGLLFAGPQPTVRERGNATLQRAFTEVFDADGATDINLHRRLMPVAEVGEGGVASQDLSVQGSLVPEIMAIAAEHEARLVFVQMPRTAARMAEERVPAELVAEFVELVNASKSATYLDMTTLGLSDTLFADAGHMNERGKAKFTAALATALQDAGAMGSAEFAPVRAPLTLPFTASREGTVPTLPPLKVRKGEAPCALRADLKAWRALSDGDLRDTNAGVGSPVLVFDGETPLARADRKAEVGAACDGTFRFRLRDLEIAPSVPAEEALGRTFTAALSPDLPHVTDQGEGWWVYPGTGLTLRFEPVQDEAAEIAVELWVEPIQVGDAGAAGGAGGFSGALAGSALDFEPEGRLLRARATRPRPDAPWTLTLASASDGPVVLVRWMRVTVGDRGLDLMGAAARVAPPAASFLDDGKIEFKPAQPDFEPIALEVRREGRVGLADVPALAPLSIEAIHHRLNCGACSPVLVLVDGEPLGSQRYQAEKVAGPDSYGLFEGVLRFIPPAGVQLARARATATLNPERAAGPGRWLYPGDRMTAQPAQKALRGLRDGARALAIQGWSFGEGAGQIDVRLMVGEEPALTARVPVASLGDEPVVLPLETPIPAGAKAVTLELSSPAGAPFVLLGAVELREAAPR